MIQQTSMQAYQELDIRKLNTWQREIYKCLKACGPGSNTMISRALNLPINIVTARMNELVKKRLVKQSHKEKCQVTNKKVIWWKAVTK